MKKILSLFLVFCLILTITACDTEKISDETSTENGTTTESEMTTESTIDTSSADSNLMEEMYQVYSFTATVIYNEWYLQVQTEDEQMRLTAEDFIISLPDGCVLEDFAIGDIVEITFRYPILETAQITDVLEIRHIVRKTTYLNIKVKVTAINGDTYTVMGMTEGYEREFLIIKENVNWEIGEELSVRYKYRGGYSETYPQFLDGAVSKVDPDPVYYKAKILEASKHWFTVRTFDGVNSIELYINFDENDVNAADFKAGDYVEFGYDGVGFPDIVHPHVTGVSMRHLTEEEIAALGVEDRTRTIILLYMGHDDKELIGIGIGYNQAYSIAIDSLETVPELNFKDYFTVVCDGDTFSYGSTTKILFPSDCYPSDRDGNRID